MLGQSATGRTADVGQVLPGVGAPSGATGGITDVSRASLTVGTYDDYAQAQRAVDHLSDSGFPVEHVAIVGTDLRLVEKVLGRMTTGRSALAGAATGAWFGLFIGLLFGIFSLTGWLAAVVAGLIIGAAWGAVFGAVTHAMTGGRRDFSSLRSLAAERYAVVVDAEHAEEARGLLVRLNWQTSSA